MPEHYQELIECELTDEKDAMEKRLKLRETESLVDHLGSP